MGLLRRYAPRNDKNTIRSNYFHTRGIKRRTALTLLIGLVCFFLLGGIALAMSSDNYGIDWSVMGHGGGTGSSDNYAATGTMGQTTIGFSSSDNYGAGSGYWTSKQPGQPPPPPPPPPVGVGGEDYPINKVAVLAPWLALAAAIIAGTSIFMRRRGAQS